MAALKVFHEGDKVSLDNSGVGVIKGYKGDGIYSIDLDIDDIDIQMHVSRLNLLTSEPTTIQQTSKFSRFKTVTDTDVDDLIVQQRNKNTVRKTTSDMAMLANYMESMGDKCQIETLAPQTLNNLLCKLFLSARKLDGTDFETTTLRGIRCSIERYWSGKNYGYNLKSAVEFTKYRAVLEAKLKELKSKGKGNLPHRSDAITDEEIERLWQTNQLGSSSPQAILNTLWFFNTIHFGLRGSDEHKQMFWGDVELKHETDGTEFLEFTERTTKTRQGADKNHTRDVTPKLWANSDNFDRYPINIFKLYRDLRPQGMSSPDSPFYIACTTVKQPSKYEKWFKCQTIGIHKLENTMKHMALLAGISTARKLTNHSARKHLIQKLNDNNIPPNQIMQITGHKNVHSINNYSSINVNQHRDISSILSRPNSAVVPHYNEGPLQKITSRRISDSHTLSSQTSPSSISPGLYIYYILTLDAK